MLSRDRYAELSATTPGKPAGSPRPISRSIVTRTFGKAADLFPILPRVLLNQR
jgi:hypothetical protein